MRILCGFLKNEEFSLATRQALRLQEQVIQVAIPSTAPQQSFDIAIDRLYHSHRYLGPAVI